MSRSGASRGIAWALVGLVLAGEVLFGAIALRLGADERSPLVATRVLFFGLVLFLAGAGLLALPGDRRPSRGWVLAASALPAWLALQLVPLPAALVGVISPARLRLAREFWPGPLTGCDGSLLLGAAPPAWLTLSVDRAETAWFLAHVTAVLAAFLFARGVFRPGSADRRLLLIVVAAFTAAEATYGIVQWTAGVPRVLWRIKDYLPEAASGTLINRNHFAALLYLGLACCLTLLAGRGRSPRPDEAREAGIRITLFVFCGLLLAGLMASQSRAGLGLAALLVLAALPQMLRGSRAVVALAVAMLALLALPMAFVVAPALLERFGGVGVVWTGGAGRGAVVRAGLGIVRDFPLAGSGGGTFERIFALYRPPDISGRYVYAHNDYLQLLIEAGVVGLLLALLPVALYAREVVRAVRRRGGGTGGPHPWPLWIGLALVALHELVDFPLQIPANAALLALLAAAAAVPAGPATRAPGAATSLFAVACLVMAPVAVLNDVARWPGSPLTWPDLADARHERHRTLIDRWRIDQRDPSPLCDALVHETRAIELRPLSAPYARDVARLSALLLADRSVAAPADVLEDQVLRMTGHARRADPWDASIRARLMEISLTVGALDLAAADARVVSSVSPTQARQVVRTLTEAGLPAPMVAELLGGEANAYRELLAVLIEDEAWDDARAVVGPDVEPTAVGCAAGSLVGTILRRAHGISPEGFFRACLELPSVQGDARLAGDLRVWLIVELLRLSRVDEAAALQEGLRRGAEEYRLRLRIGTAREDWDAVARAARSLLELGQGTLEPSAEAYLRSRLADAYARSGRPGPALRELERLRARDPDYPLIDERIRDLERGRRPGSR